jgi:hypothetical protein
LEAISWHKTFRFRFERVSAGIGIERRLRMYIGGGALAVIIIILLLIWLL